MTEDLDELKQEVISLVTAETVLPGMGYKLLAEKAREEGAKRLGLPPSEVVVWDFEGQMTGIRNNLYCFKAKNVVVEEKPQ